MNSSPPLSRSLLEPYDLLEPCDRPTHQKLTSSTWTTPIRQFPNSNVKSESFRFLRLLNLSLSANVTNHCNLLVSEVTNSRSNNLPKEYYHPRSKTIVCAQRKCSQLCLNFFTTFLVSNMLNRISEFL